jgi:hypothetical protein
LVNLDNIKVAVLNADWFHLEITPTFIELTTRGCPGSDAEISTPLASKLFIMN